jgi:thioredoxin reductase (NADPH)
MEEATFLTNHASKVYIIHRRSEFRASKVMIDRALKNPKIEVIWNTEVLEVVGEGGKLHHLKLKNNESNETSDLAVDGMFLAIGHIPVTGFINGVSTNELGYVQSEDGVRTNIEGVFVAGDVEDAKYRQAVTAAGAGCRAAMDVQKWLEARG